MKTLVIVSLFVLFFFASAQRLKGLLIVANERNNTVSFVNVETKHIISTVYSGKSPKDIALSPDHKYAAVSNYEESSITILDCISKTVMKRHKMLECSDPYGLRFMDQKHILVACRKEGVLIMKEWYTGNIIRRIPIKPLNPEHLIINKEKTRAYVTDRQKGEISAIDLTMRKRIKNIHSGSGAQGLALTEDGTDLWIANMNDNTVSIFDAYDLRLKEKLKTGRNPTRVKFTRDGKACVSCSGDDRLWIFDSQSKRKIQEIGFSKFFIVRINMKR